MTEKQTICICRLRSRIQYTKPLDNILDSFCYLLKRFVEDNKQYNYTYYNFSFGEKPSKNSDDIKNADIILIPSEAEFTYHIPGYIHTLDLKRSNQQLDELKPFFENKHVVILRSDRRDDIDLYQNYTLKDVNCKISVLDEIDFSVNIHGLKYHFIKDHMSTRIMNNAEGFNESDFIYWGGDKRKTIGGVKSGDERHTILKQIHTDKEIKSLWIGRFSNFKRDHKFMKMSELVNYLELSKSTLCFNWMDPKATTSRYIEALACGVVPLVWKNYDEDNTLVGNDWLRCNSIDEVKEKIKTLNTDLGWYSVLYHKLNNALCKILPSKDEYYMEFKKLLIDKIVVDF